jgi:protein gp37
VAEHSKIEWTDHTFNPWTGCTKISAGCDHCYAEAWSKRSGHVKWGNHARKRTTESYWKAPLIWNSKANVFYNQHRRRQRVFCASLSDVFDNKAQKAWRLDLFDLIKRCSNLDWLLLTKRPQNIGKFLPADWGDGYKNVWLGMTAEDQENYDQRWTHLSAIPSKIRFVSYEPAIGPLRLRKSIVQPDWLICGGESGHGARQMQASWAVDILHDCKTFGVAPFFKQWGTYRSNPLVSELGFSEAEASKIDPNGKGGGLVLSKIIRDFPQIEIAPEVRSSAA